MIQKAPGEAGYEHRPSFSFGSFYSRAPLAGMVPAKRLNFPRKSRRRLPGYRFGNHILGLHPFGTLGAGDPACSQPLPLPPTQATVLQRIGVIVQSLKTARDGRGQGSNGKCRLRVMS